MPYRELLYGRHFVQDLQTIIHMWQTHINEFTTFLHSPLLHDSAVLSRRNETLDSQAQPVSKTIPGPWKIYHAMRSVIDTRARRSGIRTGECSY